MTPQELKNLLDTLLAFSMLVSQQYEKYKQENNLDDESMREHLKQMNIEDDTKLNQLMLLAQT